VRSWIGKVSARADLPGVAKTYPALLLGPRMMHGGRLRPVRPNISLIQALTKLGLLTNLRLCLDAGDVDSYASGQKWLDRAGSGYDFFRGTDATSQASDPTFNGNAGGLSSAEYWSFDGGDYFTYDTSNETWMHGLHKDNAAVSVFALVQWPASGGTLFGTDGSLNTNIGAGFELRPDGTINWQVSNGSGSRALSTPSTDAFSANAWHAVGCSINEAGGNVSFYWGDGAYKQVSASNTFNASYSSPSGSNASYTMSIGSRGNAQELMPNTGRIAMLAVWTGSALTKADFDAIYAEIRNRFGI
jgi:hypothetical protein